MSLYFHNDTVPLAGCPLDTRVDYMEYSSMIRKVLLSMSACLVCTILLGCTNSAPPKTDDPAEIEQHRQEAEDMSNREMQEG